MMSNIQNVICKILVQCFSLYHILMVLFWLELRRLPLLYSLLNSLSILMSHLISNLLVHLYHFSWCPSFEFPDQLGWWAGVRSCGIVGRQLLQRFFRTFEFKSAKKMLTSSKFPCHTLFSPFHFADLSCVPVWNGWQICYFLWLMLMSSRSSLCTRWQTATTSLRTPTPSSSRHGLK